MCKEIDTIDFVVTCLVLKLAVQGCGRIYKEFSKVSERIDPTVNQEKCQNPNLSTVQ